MASDTGTSTATAAAPARGRRSQWVWGVPSVALVVVVLAVIFSHAAAPLDLGDPGAVVRWGIPVLNVLRDLTAALTVGALLLGGFLVPEGATSRRRESLARYAAWSATGWALVGAVSVVLNFADVSGTHLGSAGFASEAWASIWQLEILRAPAITALIAAAVALLAFTGPGARGMAWLFGVSLVALYPLALIGHAAGSDDHEASVDSLLVHLLAVTVWVGGLLALLLMWGRFGKGTADVVRRYSTVALWCFGAVAVSGVLNAVIRVGSFSGLASRYGVLVLVKVVLLLALGTFGALHRQRVIGHLDGAAAPGRALFARLAGVESLVMGAAVAVGVALARSAPPVAQDHGAVDTAYSLTGYVAPAAPHAVTWFTMWRVEWLLSAVSVVAVAVYLAWVIRLARRGDRWPMLRTISWCLGWLIFLYMVDGAPAVYGRVMFSVHMLEHMTVSMLVPILLVRGGVVTLALRALPKRHDLTLGPREVILSVVHSRAVAVVANPAVAAAFVFVSLIVFYYSPLFHLALTTHTGHLLMMVHFMASGYLYAWALVGIDPGPRRWAPPIRLGILLIAITFHAFFGVALMTGSDLLGGDFFQLLHLSYVSSPITDQQRGGTIAWGAGEVPTFLLAMLIAGEWYRKDTAEGERQARQADRDGDAELRAYNDYLAARSGRGKQV
ncbi:cytochrome c oxidase assembly protein [Allobranchiibius sp. CTAmp26]|uniref:cytochrome c oxidase assembly protein n=1 Tax=Allobranchiibius sp. CTAmp26 TaxID=2815214 RepID=UPI001AA1C35C|nr:cytochrome c oxidase assembly protein [Allobranchiibius sp. CTAmp26]MBO1754785.1 bifunctional copper resistance protein CopD/cytochrome c oxidase assembly protein [Allobranchiibius sp. CTAmp26]